jgi:hypothetical protein
MPEGSASTRGRMRGVCHVTDCDRICIGSPGAWHQPRDVHRCCEIVVSTAIRVSDCFALQHTVMFGLDL